MRKLNNLAKNHPAKLAEMKALFDRDARASLVYPLNNWSDLLPGFMEFQKTMGFSPAGDVPKK